MTHIEEQDCDALFRKYEDRITELEAQLAAAQAEITRLRAGGCARDQYTTQYCGELQRLVVKLSAIADAWDDAYFSNDWTATLKYCARRLREAIGGEGDGLDPRTPEYGVGFEGE